MGVFITNQAEIAGGAIVSASHVSDLYGVLSGSIAEDFRLSGSLVVTGSSNFQTITSDNFNGTTLTVTSASIDLITNNIEFSGTASMAYTTADTITSTIVNVTSGSLGHLVISGSLLIYTGSIPIVDPMMAGAVWVSGSHLMLSNG